MVAVVEVGVYVQSQFHCLFCYHRLKMMWLSEKGVRNKQRKRERQRERACRLREWDRTTTTKSREIRFFWTFYLLQQQSGRDVCSATGAANLSVRKKLIASLCSQFYVSAHFSIAKENISEPSNLMWLKNKSNKLTVFEQKNFYTNQTSDKSKLTLLTDCVFLLECWIKPFCYFGDNRCSLFTSKTK